MPTRAEQRQRVPSGHPRLFLRPEDLPRLRVLAEGKLADEFGKLRAEADRILRAGPTPEPEHRGSARDKEDQEAIKYWWPNREQTGRACKEAEALAFVYLISQDRKYGEAARHWILHLAAWDPDGPTNFRLNCEAGKVMLYRPARAYDWAHDMFTPAEREKIQASTLRRVSDAWESGEIAVRADDDGGWHEGVSYWSGYMGKAVWWLQVANSALGIDGLQKPFFARVGDYPFGSRLTDLALPRPVRRPGGKIAGHVSVHAAKRSRSVAWAALFLHFA